MSSLTTEQEREILEGTKTQAESQRFGFALEKRTQEELLRRATASKLQLGRWNKDGGMGNAAVAIKQRLAQLEFDIERCEVTVQQIEEDLAALPSEEGA